MANPPPPRAPRPSQPVFSPLRALREEMDDLISRFSRSWNGELLATDFTPPLDLSESAEALEVRIDVPGIKPEDITIEVTGNTLKVSGERKDVKEESGKTWHRIERHFGKFQETVQLPCSVREDKAHAEFHDGVLTISLPKVEQAKTHQVKIKTGGGGSSK